MLTIKEAEDKTAAQQFLDSCEISDLLAENIVMQCEENGAILGVASLCRKENKIYLNQVTTKQEDVALRLGLAKALMNLADLRGIKMLYGNNEALEKLYTALRFQKVEGEYCVSLEKYFSVGHCE